ESTLWERCSERTPPLGAPPLGALSALAALARCLPSYQWRCSAGSVPPLPSRERRFLPPLPLVGPFLFFFAGMVAASVRSASMPEARCARRVDVAPPGTGGQTPRLLGTRHRQVLFADCTGRWARARTPRSAARAPRSRLRARHPRARWGGRPGNRVTPCR